MGKMLLMAMVNFGFQADSPEIVDAWHKAGLDNGGTAIEDPPG